MGEESKKIHDAMVTQFAEMPCVSLAINAGAMERRHFLDIIVLAPYTRIKPFLDDAAERATLTGEDSGTIVMAVIKELYQKRVNVRSIVGDNLPAQVTAHAHSSSRSCLRHAEEPYLHRIQYSPCVCHFVQFVVGDIITGTCFGNLDDILGEMIMVSHLVKVPPIAKSRAFNP
jgi:hypothetical protein